MARRTKRLLYTACLVLLGTGPLHAESRDKVPSTLRMRARPKLPPLRLKQIAQAPDPVTPTSDPAPTGEPAPTPPPTPAPPPATPNVANTPDLTDEELAKLATAQEKEEGEVIVVTGSTIERRELVTPAPVSVLDKQDLDGAGLATVGDVIQNLPAQSNAINAQVNNGGDGSTRVNLRGLGTNRTLVLINGRRVVPGGLGANASVDLNAIPLAVIERVEVLKDGASAIYGSDAVGGVVNIITRTDFTGTEASLYTGVAGRGDGFTYDASFVTGHTSKKGNIIFSAGYQEQKPVFAGDRGYSNYDKNFDFATREETNGGSTSTPGGRINTRAVDVDGDGAPDPFTLCRDAAGMPAQFCTPDGSGGYRPFVTPDDFYNYQPENYLYTPSARYNVFTAGGYKLGERTRVFFEGSYLNRTSDQQLAPEPFVDAAPISSDSMYNPLGVNILGYRRRLEEFGPRRSLQNVDTFRIVTGVDGKLPEDLPGLGNWKWELSFNYGHTEGLQRNEGNLILSRLANALGPSFMGPKGPTCGAPNAEIAGCVPMNVLGSSGSITEDMINYVTFTGISNGFNEQRTALAQTSGRLLKTPWGGDVSLAVGGDFRSEEGGFTPDPLTATGDTTGNAEAPTGGSYNAFSGFGELSFVPVTEKGPAKWVELDLAARAFRYNTFGQGVTYKAGGLFRTYGGFAVRGTYSTAFRAPSVGELFQGKADSFPSAEDPCDTSPPSAGGDIIVLDPQVAAQCAAQGVAPDAQFGTGQQRSIVGGNPDLKAETARVTTAGIVFEPMKGVSLTLDYWRVNIDKAIQSLGASVILSNCYQRGLPEYCAAVHRDSTLGNQIDFIEDPIANVGGTRTSGVDFAVAYDSKIKGFGRIRNQFEGQYLFKLDLDNTLQVLHGRGNYDLGVYPTVKSNFTTMWANHGINAGFNIRYIGGYKECDANDCNSGQPSRAVDKNITADLFTGFELKSRAGLTRMTVGVNNILDQDPPLIYSGFAGDSDASTYDYMGRYFYARLSQLF